MTSPSLDDIRHDIDRIDDAILALLGQRAAATARVRSQKSDDGTLAQSPIRPAREAAMLRRLMAKRGPQVEADLLVRLWRVILVNSTLSQAPVRLHVASPAGRLDLRDHFGPMPIVEHQSAGEALAALTVTPGDIAALPADAGWAAELALGRSSAHVIATLPMIANGDSPSFLIFGMAPAHPSGGDVTLLIATEGARLYGGVQAHWQLASERYRAFAISGFLTCDDPLLLVHKTGGFRLAGRFPSAIKV